ncbi:hypothetical protein ACLQ3C_02995 [Gordonia sp. DT30]|uniref:hypothetical protein n=1 Tax=Gordonia sp. DT30 TaxID=3416546 RepID=UPI003CEB0231
MCRVSAPHPVVTNADPAGFSRRTLLRGSAAVAAGVVMVTAAAGCDRGPDPNQTTAQALLPLARSALADAAAAGALAPQVTEYSAALGVVAAQRRQHAQALREEITRLDPGATAQLDPSSSPAPNSPAPDTTAPTSARPVTSVDEMRSALSASTKAARAAAIGLSGYSAGLAGSISASTTTLMEVQLG